MAINKARRRGIGAVGAVLLGTAISVMVIYATSSPGWATLSGLVALTGTLACLEWWRASSDEGADGAARPRVAVRIRTGKVQGGRVKGAQGVSETADADIRLRTGRVSDNGEVTGYER